MSTDLSTLLQEVESQEAAEPGAFQEALVNLPIAEREILETVDQPVPFGMTAVELKSAGWSIVYHRKDRDARIVNNNMRKQVLDTRDAQKGLVFQANKPTQSPFRGALLCRLHVEDEKRTSWDELGLPVCKKSNMRTPLDVRMHMQHKHKIEWQAIEEIRQRVERDEDRALQQRILSLAAERTSEVTVAAPTTAKIYVVACPSCDHTTESSTQIAATRKMEKHGRETHAA